MKTLELIQFQTIFRSKPLLILASAVMMAISALAQANHITASVDRDNIGLQETLTLIVTADEQTRSTPDFSALKNDFDVLSTSRSQSIRIINGHTESSTDWHITLAPKRAGKLLIPSFSIDDAISDAIEIQVSKQPQSQSSSDEPVHASIEVEKYSAFVQEQILVKIKLTTQVNLSQAELQPLELKNAIVVNLNQQQYQTTVNGKPQLVVETSYAIFPQESGELVIPNLTYTVAVDSMRTWDDPFGRRGSNIMRLRTDEQHINVKAAPDKNIANSWQPANKITLNEGWSSGLDQLKVGEPVTRTITIVADGLTGGQIAPLTTANVEGLTFYPDQAQSKDNKSNKGVQGTRTETMAIIPNRPGSFTLPEITLHWWNTNSQSMQTTTLPAKTLHVVGEAKLESSTSLPASNTQQAIPEKNISPIASSAPAPNSPWLWAAIISLILLAIGLAAYVWKLKSSIKALADNQHETQEIISEKEQHIWDLLKHAAANKDALALRKAVLHWAKFHWPQQNIHSLDDVAKLGVKPALTEALKKLDELLYSTHPADDWEPTGLLQLLNECRKEKNSKKKAEPLQPLYKT